MSLVFSAEDKPSNFPEIIKNPVLQGEEKGRTAILPCEVSGNPTPTIQWFKNSIPVDMTNPRISLHEGCEYYMEMYFKTFHQLILP